MTIEEMKQQKRLLGYTFTMLSKSSGVPVGTIQKIFCGETKFPRYETRQALERALTASLEGSTGDLGKTKEHITYCDVAGDNRKELIDGVVYQMGVPTAVHQYLIGEIYSVVKAFIWQKGLEALPFFAPIEVQLDGDYQTLVHPDFLIVTHRERVLQRGLYGAPDFALEVVSTGSARTDCIQKLQKYAKAGVSEYWIVDLERKQILVYLLAQESTPVIYPLESQVPMGIFQGELVINFLEILQGMDFFHLYD